MATNSYAIDDWKQGTGTDAVVGTQNASDLDTTITNYIQDPLDKLLTHHIWGCILTHTSDDVVTIEVGEVTCSNGAGTIRRMRKNIAATTIDFTGVGVGGIDSGSARVVSTMYDIYAVADANATTFTAIAAEQGNVLVDVTYYRYIGSAYNNSADSIEKFYFIGNSATCKITYDDVYGNAELRVLNAGAAAGFTDVDCSTMVPSTSTLISFSYTCAGGENFYLRVNGSSATNGYYRVENIAGTTDVVDIPTDASQVVEYKGSNSTLYVKGYTFTR